MVNVISRRSYDENDFLHIERTHILKEGVFGYYGGEIPGGREMGLDPNQLYQCYRPWEEIEKGASTFARLPILNRHVPVGSRTMAQLMKDAVGVYGSAIVTDRPYLDCDIALWTAEAIAGIESRTVQEFSSAYRWDAVMTEGVFEGIPYTIVMTNLRGNHSAQVPESRNGHDMIAADAKPEGIKMAVVKMTKLGAGVYHSLKNMSPKLAMDSALPGLCARMTKRNTDPIAFKKAVLAMDADIAPENVDDVIDALLEIDNSPEPVTAESAMDEKKGKLSALLQGKIEDDVLAQVLAIACDETVMPEPAAEDEEEKPDTETPPTKEEGDKPTGTEDEESKPTGDENEEEQTPTVSGDEDETYDKPAMDAAIAKATADATRKVTELFEAKKLVEPVVGEIVVAMDSAVSVLNFALDHLKVKREGITTYAGLKTLFQNATAETVAKPNPRLAMDAEVDVVKKYNLNRFK